ncbi:MAG TPA: cell wall-binding repeat-containing protein [Firmicutes bacterium]|nr:cell wall-binding repeat-containing protein [Bacillota bacterium]
MKTALGKLPSVNNVTRLAGANRYETSVEFAKDQFSGVGNFCLVRGADANLADAIGSTILGFPILYVARDLISSSVNDYLNREVTSLSDIYVIGGTSAISERVYTDARAKITGDDTCKFEKSCVNQYDTDGFKNKITISGTTFKNISYKERDHYTISALPKGVTATLKRTGNYTADLTLSGTPYPVLTSNKTVSVRILGAAVSSGRNLTSASFTITVLGATVGGLTLNETFLEATETGVYKFTFKASGGKSPYTYSLLKGTTLPGWLKNDATLVGWVFTATPIDNSAGTYRFGVEVSDKGTGSNKKTSIFEITLKVYKKPVFDLTGDNAPSGATIGKKYSFDFDTTVTGGKTPRSYALLLTSGSLPGSMTFKSNGILSGTPKIGEEGDFKFKVRVIDENFVITDSEEITIEVKGAPTIPDPIPILSEIMWGKKVEPISLGITGGTQPYTINITKGQIPKGMSFNENGELSGTPIGDIKKYEFSIMATDYYGVTSSIGAYTITVTQPTT